MLKQFKHRARQHFGARFFPNTSNHNSPVNYAGEL